MWKETSRETPTRLKQRDFRPQVKKCLREGGDQLALKGSTSMLPGKARAACPREGGFLIYS